MQTPYFSQYTDASWAKEIKKIGTVVYGACHRFASPDLDGHG